MTHFSFVVIFVFVFIFYFPLLMFSIFILIYQTELTCACIPYTSSVVFQEASSRYVDS